MTSISVKPLVRQFELMMKYKLLYMFALCAGIHASLRGQEIAGELKRWHKVTLNFEGPNTSETAVINPFSDYALEVTFNHTSGLSYVIPGYYAGCADAANAGCDSGNIWSVHFAPGLTGTWTWTASFRTGTDVAIDGGGTSAGYMDGDTGSLSILESDKLGADLRSKDKGMLQYVGEHYLRYSGTSPTSPNGAWFVKAGADSPENTMAYEDFDNTPNRGDRRKSWAAHQQDYVASEASDYTWDGGKGSELLGVVNYLASEGANSMSFLTFSLGGDDENVFPHLLKVSENVYNGYNDAQQWSSGVHKDRFDNSKLAQWEKIFQYADQKGMYLHFKTLETENDNFMDGNTNGRERKLYYRTLIARFGHHLALNWNITEETTIPDSVTIAVIDYIHSIDPYHHNIVIHTYPGDKSKKYTPLLGENSKLSGASLQSNVNSVHDDVIEWIEKSKNAKRKWVVANDEQGPASTGVRIDDKEVRQQVLYATFMAGGAGVEYYYGYTDTDGDLNNQDHRLRGQKYEEAGYALRFFGIHFNDYLLDAVSDDGLTKATNDYVLANEGKAYAIYLPSGGTTALSLPTGNEAYNVQWFNPRSGALGEATTLGNTLSAPDASNDWVALIVAKDENNNGSENVAPQVVIQTPVTGTSVTEGTTVAVTADASDSNGSIAQVEFFVNGESIRIERVPPYEASLEDYLPGIHVITAVATDNDGATTTSATVTITITEEITGPPVLGNCEEKIFEEVDGMVAVEAEDFLSQSKIENREWFVIGDGALTPTPDPDDPNSDTASGGKYIEILPDTRVTHDDPLVRGVSFSNTAGEIAVIDYKVYINNPGKYYVWVRAHSTGTEDNGVHVGLDGAWPSTGNRMQWCSGKGAWTWESKQRTTEIHCGVEELIYLDIPTTGIHTISFSMREDGFEMDKFILSKSYTKPVNEGLSPLLYDCDTIEETNVAPEVSISSPGSGISVKEGTAIPLTAVATDSDGAITQVEFFVNGKSLAVEKVAPFTAVLSGYEPGIYAITAVATDDDGATTTSTAITITITDNTPIPNVAPEISISEPASNISVGEGTDLALAAVASDSDGSVVQVEFFVDGKSFAIERVAPYTAMLSDYSPGSYGITAIATDDDGATTTSAAITITITENTPIPNLAPTVDISEPASDISVIEGTNITLTAMASDSDGSVVQVEFFVDGQSLAIQRVVPYMVTLANYEPGAYEITAVATDDDGATAVSQTVSIVITETIGNPDHTSGALTLTPIHDAYMQGDMSYNHEIVRVENGNRTGYLMFDLSSVGGPITEAVLELTITDDIGSGEIMAYHGTSNSWTETNLSNNNRPEMGAHLGSIVGGHTMGAVRTIVLDPSAISDAEKLSIVLSQADGNDIAFASKENRSVAAPKLMLRYGDAAPIIKTVSLAPIHDAFVDSGTGYNQSIVRVEYGRRTGYLMFDLSEIIGDVISSTLQFSITEDSGNGDLHIYKGTSDLWSETTINGSTRPYQGDLLGRREGSFDLNTTVSVPLDPDPIYGDRLSMVMQLLDGNDFAFASKENTTTTGPRLEVVYNSNVAKRTIHQDFDLTLFPNPATDEVSISSSNLRGQIIRLHALTGILLKEIRAEGNTAILDVSDFASGYYLVSVVDDQSFTSSVFKLFVE